MSASEPSPRRESPSPSPSPSPQREFSDASGSLDAEYGPEIATGRRDSLDRDSPTNSSLSRDISENSDRGNIGNAETGGCVFPTRDFDTVVDGLRRHPHWVVFPKQMGGVLMSAFEIVNTGDVEGKKRADELRTLYREVVPSFFDKCVVADDVQNWEPVIQADILLCGKALCELVAVRMTQALVVSTRGRRGDPDEPGGAFREGTPGPRSRDALQPSTCYHTETAEETDAVCLLQAAVLVLTRSSPFHVKNKHSRVPGIHRQHDLTAHVDRGRHAKRNRGRSVGGRYGGDDRNDSAGRYSGNNDSGVIDITADDIATDSGDPRFSGFDAFDDDRADFGRFDREGNGGDFFDNRDDSQRDDDRDGSQRDDQSGDHQWCSFLVDAFGSNGGFDAVCEILTSGEKVSWSLLNAAAKIAARCAMEVNARTLETLVFAVEVALSRCAVLMGAAINDSQPAVPPEEATGQESCLFPTGKQSHTPTPQTEDDVPRVAKSVDDFLQISALAKSARLVFESAFGKHEACEKVKLVVRAVIEGLLDVNTFNAQLAALREINLVLTSETSETDASTANDPSTANDASTATAVFSAWMERKNLLAKTLLPTFLHHKLYVDQVCFMLRRLLRRRVLHKKHVSALWEVARRKDSFEDTKKNVLDLLARAASEFDEAQLEFLFSRIEEAWVLRAGDGGECTTNTHRTATHASSPEEDNGDDLLVMVQKLAHGDTRGTAAERTLRLLRRAVVDASTRELTNRDDDEQETDNAADRTTAVFANVLSHYDGLGVTCASVRQWTLIFLTEIATATDDATLAGSARAFKAVAGLEISDGSTENTLVGVPVPKKKGLKKRRLDAERDAFARDGRRRDRLRDLARDADAVEVLTSALERFQARFVEKTNAAAGTRKRNGSNLAVSQNLNVDRTLRTLVETLLFVLKDGELTVGPGVGRRLWRVLIEAPNAFVASETDEKQLEKALTARSQGMGWMTELLMVPPRVMTCECVAQLLKDCIETQPANIMTLRGYFLFRAYFLQTGLDGGKLSGKTPGPVRESMEATPVSPDRDSVIDIDIDDVGQGTERNTLRRVPVARVIRSDDRNEGQLAAIRATRPPYLSDVVADDLETTELCDLIDVESRGFPGFEHLWDIALNAPPDAPSLDSTGDSQVASLAIDQLIQLHVKISRRDFGGLGGDETREATAREAFVARTLEHLSQATAGIASSGDLRSGNGVVNGATVSGSPQTETSALAEQRASRCLLLLTQLIAACEDEALASGGTHKPSPVWSDAPRNQIPHGGSYRGFPVELEISVISAADTREGSLGVSVSAHANATVRWVKTRVAKAIADERFARASGAYRTSPSGVPLVDFRNVRLVVNGRDLGRHDDETLSQSLLASDFLNGAVRAHALLHRSGARFAIGRSDAASEYSPQYSPDTNHDSVSNERSPRALLARHTDTYDALFELADCACAVARSRAQALLNVLPTRQVVTDELRLLLFDGDDVGSSVELKRSRLQALLSQSPFRGVYVVQALDGLLTPSDLGCAAMLSDVDTADTADAVSNDMDVPTGGENDERDEPSADDAAAHELKIAKTALAFRAAFLKRGYANDVLSLLPSGVDGCDVGDAVVGIATANSAWRDGGLRKQTASSALSLLRVALTDDDPSLAQTAAPKLATLARFFAQSDETKSDDERIATTSLELFFQCVNACVCENEVPASALLRVSCFKSTLRDVLCRAPSVSVRRVFLYATVRCAMRLTHEAAVGDKTETEESTPPRKVRTLCLPPGFAEIVLELLPEAEKKPTQCREYFTLLGTLLRCPQDDSSPMFDARAQARLDAAAAALFVDEVNALCVCPPETDADHEPDPRLVARLEILRTLVERLGGGAACGSARELAVGFHRKLIRTLLFRCLFPESVPLLRPTHEVLADAGVFVFSEGAEASARLTRDDATEDTERDDSDTQEFAKRFGLAADVSITDTHLSPACIVPTTRAAAFKLLSRLVPCDTKNEIVNLIHDLHHSGPIGVDGSNAQHARFDAKSFEKQKTTARASTGYVGLKNAGATCYMNAVFQQLFAIPRLRNDILSVQSACATSDERANSVFHQLQQTFAALSLSKLAHHSPVGFWAAFKDYDGEPINVREHQDGLEFFGRLQDMVDNEYKQAVRVAFEKQKSDPDFCEAQTQPLVAAPTPIKGAVETSMGGKFVNQVLSKQCPHVSERLEDFVHVSVDVRGKTTLNESLQSYVSGELLEADNAWFCEQCGCKRDAVKRSCFVGNCLPQTLCVHLKRFEFDYETMQRLKIKSRFEFPNELDMAPFTVEAMDGGGGGSGGSTDAQGGDCVRDGDAHVVTQETLSDDAHVVTQETGSADAQTPMEASPSASSSKEKGMYKLAGVVVHSGTAFAGHYYSMIREREAPTGGLVGAPNTTMRSESAAEVPSDLTTQDPAIGKRWYIYDDQRVEAYDVSDLDADAFGGAFVPSSSGLQNPDMAQYDRPNSAYLLFYEKVNCDAKCGVGDIQGSVHTPSPVSPEDASVPPAPVRFPPVPAIPNMPRGVQLAVMRRNLKFAFDANVNDAEYFLFMQALALRVLRGGKEELASLGRRERSGGQPGTTRDDATLDREGVSTRLGGETRETQHRKKAKMKRGDTPGGGNDESDFSDSGEIEQAKTIPGEDSEDPGEVSSSAVRAVTLSVNFLCRTYLRAPFVLRDPETLRKWREMVTGLVTGSFGARVWLLTWLQRNNALLEIFLGRSLSAEARDTFAVIASAAVRGPTPAIDKHGSGGNGSTLTCVSSVNEISALVDSVVRDVARGASAANEETQLEHGAVVSWYFVVLNAFVCGDDGGKDKERTYKRVCRLSRLDILEPLLECACLLGSKAGRRREVYNRRRLHDDGTLDDRGKECMSAVWNLCCLVLRAADTTQARRVFASRCAQRAAGLLGFEFGERGALAGGAGGGFFVLDLECDGMVPSVDETDDELARIAQAHPSPYGLGFNTDTGGKHTGEGKTEANAWTETDADGASGARKVVCAPRLSLGAFQKTFDFDFITCLVKVATANGSGAGGHNARAALCHLSWRWETMTYVVVLHVLYKLAHADSAEAVVGILRLVESLLRMRDDLSFQKLRCGFLLEGQTFRNPHALATVPGRTLDPCVPPHVRVALSSVSDKSQGEFPSGVIEAGAFDACSAAKRFLISRFLVMMADDESGDGTSEHVLTSLATQHEDFGFVVGAFSDVAHKMDACDVASEDEDEVGCEKRTRDETLDDPLTVLQRGELLLARTAPGV